jgi:hypothetical protein
MQKLVFIPPDIRLLVVHSVVNLPVLF